MTIEGAIVRTIVEGVWPVIVGAIIVATVKRIRAIEAVGRYQTSCVGCSVSAACTQHHVREMAECESLAVGADYGLTVITDASAAAGRFAQFILSPAGQKILTTYGFASGQN
jgi:ABC-type molybdate transport system substrate-binding protein